MSQVLYTQSARTDLLEAWSFIAEGSIVAADNVLDTIDREASILALQPLMVRVRTELADGVHSWPTSTPYILFYLVNDTGITVLRALHHARDVQRGSF